MSVALGIEPARPREEAPPPLPGSRSSSGTGRADDLGLRRPDQRARDPADGHSRARRLGAPGRDPRLARLAAAPALLAAGGRLDRPARESPAEHDRRGHPAGGGPRDDPRRVVARGADHVAAARGRVRGRRVHRLLRPLQRLVLRRARRPRAVRRCEQQVLDDAARSRTSADRARRASSSSCWAPPWRSRRRALLRRLSGRAARREGLGAGGRAERDERPHRAGRGLPLPARRESASRGDRLHEHDQLLQLLRLRDLRALREPDARAQRGPDRPDPRRGLLRCARGRPDRAARRAEARDRPGGRRRVDPVPGSDGAVPAGAWLGVAGGLDAPRRRVPGERRRDDLRHQPEQPDGDAHPAGRSQPGGRGRRASSTTGRGRSERCSAVCSARRSGCARRSGSPSSAACSAPLFLVASPMPSIREEDLA